MRLIIAFCLLSLRAFAADNPPTVVRTDCYVVRGTNAQALQASLAQRRPFAYNAHTEWYIDWNYAFLIKPDECTLRSFDVRVQIR